MGKEPGEHARHAQEVGAPDEHRETSRRDRTVTIIEALLLAVVAVLAAWSGFAAAKWGTDSRLELAQAAASRTEASSSSLVAESKRNFDASTFNAWFSAKVANNQMGMDIAQRRFSPEFRAAFDAWIATNPDTNPGAPPGPSYMPQYSQPELLAANTLNAEADHLFEEGSTDAARSDDYVRTTVYLATVLFLVGISGHFRVQGARTGLIVVGVVILTFAIWQLVSLPKP
ncbi:MAG: hypothetical protein ACHQNA_13180, partial [Acidimicrobiales bacterium]